jgi:hypothetical protein
MGNWYINRTVIPAKAGIHSQSHAIISGVAFFSYEFVSRGGAATPTDQSFSRNDEKK